MIFRPSESFSANSSTDFLSVIDPSIMRPKNRTGIEWIDGMNKEKSVGLDGSETQKGELFSDLPFLIMKLRDLSARNSIPAHCRAVAHLARSVWAPETEEDIKFTSSIKAFTKGSDTLLEVIKWGAQATRTYSKMIFIPAKNKMIESVQPAKIPLWCWCQLLGADSENDLL